MKRKKNTSEENLKVVDQKEKSSRQKLKYPQALSKLQNYSF